MIAGQLVIAYHGCDITTRDGLVSRRLERIDHSRNRYDWLGPGAYFFEGDMDRALLFAQASHEKPERMYTARPIATPAVVGAILRIHNWLDMTTQEGIREFCDAYEPMMRGIDAEGAEPPENRPSAEDDHEIIYRALDNAVFTFIHKFRANGKSGLPAYQAVRGAFHQRPEIAPRSGFHRTTHVQIAVRDDHCIVGWFLPEGASLLDAERYADARERLAALPKTYKRRVRA